MKLAPVFLLASLAANVLLVGAWWLRSSADRTSIPRNAVTPAAESPASSLALSSSSFVHDDLRALEAAGVPAEVARDLVLGRAIRRAGLRALAEQTARRDTRWWRSPRPSDGDALGRARREFSDALAAALGQDPLFAATGPNLDFLPADKRQALRRITQDYDEMMAQFSAHGIQLASDREKMRLLRVEKERDIAALLSPEELADYELRTSPSSATVRSRYGDGIETEEDFRALVALQKAFDEQFPRDAMTGTVARETMQARMEAERKLHADMRAALGENNYAQMRRATDSDLRALESLVARLNMPADTTTTIAAARDAYALESQQITHDASLSIEERKARLQALGQRAKADLTQALGAEAADAYVQRSSWVSLLQNGVAYSTTAENSAYRTLLPGQNVVPVLPPGASGARANMLAFRAASSALSPAGFAGSALRESGQEMVRVTTFDAPAAGEPAQPAAVGAFLNVTPGFPLPQPPPPAAPVEAQPKQ